jgi:Lrp/AsnC family transcriptional regulator for asnA, asnC and gidA
MKKVENLSRTLQIRPDEDALVRHFHNLDQVEVRLIAELEINPKQTQAELALKLGLSQPTVRAKLQRLFDDNIIKTVCVSDPGALGYSTCVIIGINVHPSELLSVADRLSDFETVYHIMLCIGRFDILAWALFQNRNDFLEFFVNKVGNLSGVLKTETMLTLRHVKIYDPLFPYNGDPRANQVPVKRLDALDSALISELQVDARQNARDVAKKLGTSQSTVLRRIRKLQDDGIIRIVTLADPFSLGYEGVASVCMTFDPAKVNEGARTIASYPNVRTVSICAGRYDIVAWTLFREMAELSDFVTLELSKISGLQHSETMANLKLLKTTHKYLRDDTRL